MHTQGCGYGHWGAVAARVRIPRVIMSTGDATFAIGAVPAGQAGHGIPGRVACLSKTAKWISGVRYNDTQSCVLKLTVALVRA